MVGSPIILWQILCSAQKTQQFCIPPVHLCVDLRHLLSWSSAAHAVSSFNVMHIPLSFPPAFKDLKRRNGQKKGPSRADHFPSSPPLTVSTSHTDRHLFICPCRTAPLCSSAPTSWTRKTSSANRILSWCSTEVTRMERESVALLSLYFQLQVLWGENQQYFSQRGPRAMLRCWGADPKVWLKWCYQREVQIISCFSLTRAN